MHWLWSPMVLRSGMYVRSPIIGVHLNAHMFTGQKLHWDSNHKLICSVQFEFMTSETCESLPDDQMIDCIVLSQLMAKIALQRPEHAAPIATFESLLPSPLELETPPVIPMKRLDPSLRSRAPALYRRFPNNNHVIPIHLRGIGVAILPLMSRLLNHSCSPNAVLRYILSASQRPRAEVVAIREISEGEEVRVTINSPTRKIFTSPTRCRSRISTPRSLIRTDRPASETPTVLIARASCAPLRRRWTSARSMNPRS